ncbi:MAG: hypothetical protein KatS3mg112_0906 [Thermogutta sp.]|nr:MAG: hypothetical protein KatS3mg112_0906 [Thermogutta sp.]
MCGKTDRFFRKRALVMRDGTEPILQCEKADLPGRSPCGVWRTHLVAALTDPGTSLPTEPVAFLKTVVAGKDGLRVE